MDVPPALADPASLLLGIASLSGMVAGAFWWRFATVADKLGTSEGWTARRRLGHAATLTAIALALAGGAYLLGRLTGRF